MEVFQSQSQMLYLVGTEQTGNDYKLISPGRAGEDSSWQE